MIFVLQLRVIIIIDHTLDMCIIVGELEISFVDWKQLTSCHYFQPFMLTPVLYIYAVAVFCGENFHVPKSASDSTK